MTNLKDKIANLKSHVSPAALAAPVVGAATVLGSSVMAFASESGGSSLPTIAITTDMLTPLVEGVVANIGVILPVGLGMYAIFLGIRIIPGLISRFVRM